MKVFNELIKVSKESILKKHFGIDMEAYNKLSEKDKLAANELFPTEDEKLFMEVYKSTAPQLARLQRKMSVCLEVEVTEYDFDKVVFKYGKSDYMLLAPKNAYRICLAIDKGAIEALVEMAKQGCLIIDGNIVSDILKDGALQVDEMQILKSVADKFFFQTFMT